MPKSFQNAIEEAVIKTSKQGLFGWEVTDVKVTLSCGEFFSPASTPADFRNVTPMVFMEALYKAQTVLLEPLHEFELKDSSKCFKQSGMGFRNYEGNL